MPQVNLHIRSSAADTFLTIGLPPKRNRLHLSHQERTVSLNTQRPDIAISIMASKGLEIPFEANGSVSLCRLQRAMNETDLSKERQTFVKTSLLCAGVVLVP